MKNTSILAKCIALTASTVASLCGQVDAIPPPIGEFGMIGGARGQTLRLNVVNRPAQAGFPSGPCRATIGFADATGSAYPPGPTRNVDLAPGQAAFVQFDFDRVLTQFGQRLQLRPVVIPAYEGSAQGCIASAEMFDQFTGRTMAYTAAYAAQEPPPVGEQAPPHP